MRSLCLLALLGLVACAPDARQDEAAAEEEGSTAAAITNGKVDEADRATVALIDKNGDAYCTGVLVSPYVVATAAHCLADTTPRRVFFGIDPNKDDDTFIEVSRTTTHGDFDRETLTNDIALIGLESRAPTKPARIIRRDEIDASWVGRNIRVVGFGLVKGTASKTGAKRYGNSEIEAVEDGTFRFKGAPAQTCHGDSGGPAFAKIDGRDVLVGITSSGDADCKQYGRDTRIDQHHDFIADFAETYDAEQSAPPIENMGCSSAGGTSSTRDDTVAFVIAFAFSLAVFVRRRSW